MAILNNSQGGLQQVPIYNYEKSLETAKSINVRCDFALDTIYTGNLSQEKRQGIFQSIRSIYFNCENCANNVAFTCVDTGQSLTFKAGTQGYLPLLVSQGMTFRFVGVSPDVGVFNLLNVDMPPAIWPELVDGPIPFSDIEMTGPALLGRYTAGLGATEEIQLGAGLSFVGDTLTMGAGGPYVLKAGDTMTGPLVIDAGSGFDPGSACLTVKSTDSGNVGPFISLFHDSASPSVGDFSAGIRVSYNTDTAARVHSTVLGIETTNVTNGADAFRGYLAARQAGSNSVRLYFGAGIWSIGATGGDQGVNTANFSNYFDDGVNINTIYAGLAAANVFSNAAGQTIQMTGAPGTASASQGTLLLNVTDTGVTGPILNFNHSSASPAANDTIGSFQFWGNDNGGTNKRFGIFRMVATDVTAGSEDSRINWFTIIAGSLEQRFVIQNGLFTPNATGSDQGADTFNCLALYTNGNIIADANSLIRNRVFTVGTLPAVVAGGNAQVSDATQTLTAGIGAVVVGGGANNVPVNSDGTNWRIG